jgi:hypothetical protein
VNDTDLQMFQSLFTEPEPAPQVVAAGRARLQHSYRRPGFRLPRFSVPVLAGLGTAAAAAAAVVVVAISAIAPPAPGSARPAPGSAPRAVISLTASQVLLTAARTVASLPAAQPSPQQWLLISSVEYQAGAKAVTSREWTTFNGVRSAYYQAGKLVTHSAPVPAAIADGSPMGAYDELRKLPPYPQNLLAALSRASAGQVIADGSTQARAWQNIMQLLWNSPVAAPPKQQAEIFIALTKIPGLRVEHVTDALGKPAIGLYLPAAGHSDLLLDPNTYQVVGRLSISNGRYTKAEREMAKIKKFTLYPVGTITWSIVRSTTTVSGPGQS